MRGLWAKLNLKDQRQIVVLNAPGSFEAEFKALERVRVDRRMSEVKELLDATCSQFGTVVLSLLYRSLETLHGVCSTTL
jgi:hypothetical protein